MTDRIVRTDTLVMVNAAGNHNKVWRITLYENGTITTEWGRVGHNLQSKSKQHPVDRANGEYEKLVLSKLDKGYSRPMLEQQSEQSLDLSALPPAIQRQFHQIAQLAEPVEQHTLVRWNPNKGYFVGPFAVVGRNTCNRAKQLITQISHATSDFNTLVEAYLRLIPLNAGQKLDPQKLLGSHDKLHLQLQVLDNIEACYDLVAAIKGQVVQALQSQHSWIGQSRSMWVEWGDEEQTTFTPTTNDRSRIVEW